MQELFDAIREACSANTWSRGVELARADAVRGGPEADAPDRKARPGQSDWALQVCEPGRPIAASVHLSPRDEDWDCDCRSQTEACEHVAAAVIAVRRSLREGHGLGGDEARPLGRLRYLLARSGRGLSFERDIVAGETVHRLETTLDAIARGRVPGPRFAATQADMAVELALGTRRRGPLDQATLGRLAPALSRCEDVRLDGRPVAVSTEAVRPRVVVDEVSGGFRLKLRAPKGIDEHFAPLGFVRCGDTLRPIGTSGLSGRETHELGPASSSPMTTPRASRPK